MSLGSLGMLYQARGRSSAHAEPGEARIGALVRQAVR
jgi:hypothetical protein